MFDASSVPRTANQIMVKNVLKTVLNTVQGQGTNIGKQNCNKKRKIHSPESSLLPSHKKANQIGNKNKALQRNGATKYALSFKYTLKQKKD